VLKYTFVHLYTFTYSLYTSFSWLSAFWQRLQLISQSNRRIFDSVHAYVKVKVNYERRIRRLREYQNTSLVILPKNMTQNNHKIVREKQEREGEKFNE